jgi:hypothetical protein
LFISHAWGYSKDYDGVVALLKSDTSFYWEDLSVPEDNPLLSPPELAKSFHSIIHRIDEKIAKADCLLVIAGMYVNHSSWIQTEIESALRCAKPIIAVLPRGCERRPLTATFGARAEVGWNAASIISAVRQHAPPSFPTPPNKLLGGPR